MSKICIGVILDCSLKLSELQNNLKKKGRKYGVGISFDLNYNEYFMEYYSDKTIIFVEFNDNENSSNCEMLLLPMEIDDFKWYSLLRQPNYLLCD